MLGIVDYLVLVGSPIELLAKLYYSLHFGSKPRIKYPTNALRYSKKLPFLLVEPPELMNDRVQHKGEPNHYGLAVNFLQLEQLVEMRLTQD